MTKVSSRSLASRVGLPVLVVAATLAAMAVSAGSATAETSSSAGNPIGTWDQTVHIPNGPNEPTEVSLHPDGTVSSVSPSGPAPCASGPEPCTLGMPSTGIWRHTGPKTFEFTIKEYIYDSAGNVNGFIIPDVTATFTGRDSYTAASNTGVWTVDGVRVFVIASTADGQRMAFPPPV